ncbi:unnamed protein product [Rotaria sp. Silwood2]|nr:unnamed protein product [Rotaria sp. Silwood2]CAF4391793.1 unnamed protein product [Rotaria sp. Silwood2]CAF4427863.1 unnamed protein product [Rotaria sp. Silwood2]CAF4708625.1 unnamed protein product [Rotaria sp. Silwood2]
MLYVADNNNNRIQVFSLNQSSNIGTTVVSFVAGPQRIYVDTDGNEPTLYVTAVYPYCVLKYVKGASVSVKIGDSLFGCSGISIDNEKNIYVVASYLHIVQKYSPLTNSTTIIAGQRGVINSTSKHLNTPEGIYLDQTSGAIYVADTYNARIQKWLKDAQEGITVAGSSEGFGGGDAASLLGPKDVFVDKETNVVYIIDSFNNRIQRYLPNATKGDTIAGGFGR